MWQAVVDWWLDDLVQAELQTITGIAGAVLAGFAIYFAWKVAKKQFTMMQDQDKLMNRHVKLAKRQADSLRRQEQLTAELKGLTETQAKIAQTQHKIFQEQLIRRADLFMLLRSEPEGNILNSAAKYHLFVKNKGNKTCHELRWALFIPLPFANRFDFSINVTMFDPGDDKGWQVRKVTGLLREVIFPGEENMILTLTVKKELDKPLKIPVSWSVVAEDGRFPQDEEIAALMLDIKPTLPESAFEKPD